MHAGWAYFEHLFLGSGPYERTAQFEVGRKKALPKTFWFSQYSPQYSPSAPKAPPDRSFSGKKLPQGLVGGRALGQLYAKRDLSGGAFGALEPRALENQKFLLELFSGQLQTALRRPRRAPRHISRKFKVERSPRRTLALHTPAAGSANRHHGQVQVHFVVTGRPFPHAVPAKSNQ